MVQVRRTAKQTKSRGFSLLETLIVLGILAVMALIASRAIKGALLNKNKIDARLKTETVVFDALRIVATDIERAFHYQYALYELDRQVIAQQIQTQEGAIPPGQPPPQVAATADGEDLAMPPPPERLTQFIGKDDQLHFTTLNHQRTTFNAQESNQSEVGYYLADCKSRVTDKTSRCLWRRASTLIDNDVTRGGMATPLVENVSDFHFEYLSEDFNDKEWRKSWLTDNNGTPQTQNMFPSMVRVVLEVHDKDNKEIGKFRQTIIATIRFPNNTDPAKRFAPAGTAGQQGTSTTTPPPGMTQ
jgi:prepilin-type N-terminal cleavage/methylation domain-containing protein